MNQASQALLDRYKVSSEEELIEYIDQLKYNREINQGFIPVSEMLADCVIIANEKGNIVYANKTAHTLFQYNSMHGMNITLLMPDRYIDRHLEAMSNANRYKPYLDSVAYMYAKKSDGTEFPMSISLTKYRKNGEYNYIGIIRDATRAVHDLEVFKLVFKNLPVMVAIFNEEAKFEYINEKFFEVLGVTEDDLSEGIDPIMINDIDVIDGLKHMFEDNQEWRKFDLRARDGSVINTAWYNIKLFSKWMAVGIQLNELPSSEQLLRNALDIVIMGKTLNGRTT